MTVLFPPAELQSYPSKAWWQGLLTDKKPKTSNFSSFGEVRSQSPTMLSMVIEELRIILYLCNFFGSSVISVLEWLWRSFELFKTCLNLIFRKIWHVLFTICLHANRQENVTCNFNCRIKAEGLLKVTVTYAKVVIYRKRCKIETKVVPTDRW